MTALLIAAGGALGTLARYALGVWCAQAFGPTFPFGTLAVNVLGSFGLAVIAEAFAGGTIAGVDARLVLGVGVMGGFTTYSSFNLELLRLVEQGQLVKAGGYFAATVVGCVVAGAAGVVLARWGGAAQV